MKGKKPATKPATDPATNRALADVCASLRVSESDPKVAYLRARAALEANPCLGFTFPHPPQTIPDFEQAGHGVLRFAIENFQGHKVTWGIEWDGWYDHFFIFYGLHRHPRFALSSLTASTMERIARDIYAFQKRKNP